jgi:alkyldihydroxyacetonephosphate synthase
MALARPDRPHPEPALMGWGDPAQIPVLPDGVLALLRDGLGVRAPASASPDPESIVLPEVRSAPEAKAALSAIVGAEHVRNDHATRLAHTRGRSTPDLLRLRAGDAGDAPDLVVFPASHEDVLEILSLASRERIAVVPYGGGTSVVGGLECSAAQLTGVLALDMRRLDALIDLDEESRLATLAPGLRGPQAEELLGARGYTLGHFPQSFQYASLGGFAAARSSGQASAGYGRFDDLVMALRAATPVGTLTLGRAPRSAAGPDLRQLLLGSEGALGVITALTLQIRPSPALRRYEGWRFASFRAGTSALRALAQDGPRPTVLRLSDEAETAVSLADPAALGASGTGALAIVGYEGSEDDVAVRSAAGAAVLGAHGATRQEGAGESWEHGRYQGPYLRDALLSAGALVETLETACFWSALPSVYARVAEAIREALTAQGTPPVILCHVSHVYATGASLYFTIACAQTQDPVGQWRAAKAAASEAILTEGASITHHHGVGRDHRDAYLREIGDVGVRALRAVKRELDPAGILNPGVLLPEP